MGRGFLFGVCAVALSLGSVVVASPAAADGCPYGTVATHFNGVCVSGQGGGQAPPAVVNPENVSSGGPPGSAFSSVDGVPCNPNHASSCIGLSQNQ